MFRWCLQVFLSKWAVPGLFFFIIVLSFQYNVPHKKLLMTGFELSGHLVSEATALPTAPQPLPSLYVSLLANIVSFFKKMGQTRPLFLFIFVLFSHHMEKYSTNLTINEKSVDGMLGSRTRGGSLEGADESTELRRHPNIISLRTSIMQLAPYLNVGLGTS